MTNRVCEMVTEDEKAVFGFSQCRLDTVGNFHVKGYGRVELCEYHRDEFAEEILA